MFSLSLWKHSLSGLQVRKQALSCHCRNTVHVKALSLISAVFAAIIPRGNWKGRETGGGIEGPSRLQCYEWNIIKHACQLRESIIRELSVSGRKVRREERINSLEEGQKSLYKTPILNNVCWIIWAFFFFISSLKKKILVLFLPFDSQFCSMFTPSVKGGKERCTWKDW